MSQTNDDKKNEKASESKGSKKETKEINPVTFVRKDPRPGIYSNNVLAKKFKLVNRSAFIAETGAAIDFCKNDPELIELSGFNKQYEKKNSKK